MYLKFAKMVDFKCSHHKKKEQRKKMVTMWGDRHVNELDCVTLSWCIQNIVMYTLNIYDPYCQFYLKKAEKKIRNSAVNRTRKESLLTSPCILWARLIFVILQQSTEQHLKESWEAVFMGSTVEDGCSVVSDAVTGTKSQCCKRIYTVSVQTGSQES